ncbi:hypothetical protein FGB62_12g434 [Gracilaria domingensis]|nr:hypothetical protein FGB62_12g434 [Gracilaria domingensis]
MVPLALHRTFQAIIFIRKGFHAPSEALEGLSHAAPPYIHERVSRSQSFMPGSGLETQVFSSTLNVSCDISLGGGVSEWISKHIVNHAKYSLMH